ncbi:MAG: hypothetical protein R2797_01955 [Gelidibacter sp.]
MVVNSFLNTLLESSELKSSKENFLKFEVKFSSKRIAEISNLLTESVYNELNDFLVKQNYKWELTIEKVQYSVSQEKYIPLEADEQSEVEFEINFIIFKTGNNILVFDENIFYNHLENLSLSSILDSLKNKFFPLEFIFTKNKLIFGCDNDTEKHILSTQCNFRNYIKYPFYPNYFYSEHLNQEIKNSTVLEKTFFKLTILYSLIYLFDTSEIIEDKIKLSISGIKTFHYNLDFNDLSEFTLLEYYNIYKWVYSENRKIEDKIGIVRNIITSYINGHSIIIEKSAFISILSSNKIYVKGNISKYFEVRNKMIESIETTIEKINKSLDSFFNNFQKSVFVFISFFLSVFLFKIVRQEGPEKIFNKETSLLGLGLIFLSFLFLLYSIYLLNMDKKRVKERYENVKNRFRDVLIDEDIEKILNNNSEYDDEMIYFDEKVKIHKGLWIASLILFVVILFLASDYLEVSNIWDYFFKPTPNK